MKLGARRHIPKDARRLIGFRGFSILALFLLAAAPGTTRGDLDVLIPGGTRTILARSGDSLTGGGTLRGSLDQIFWFPSGYEQGHLFVNHELAFPDGGLSRLRYENGAITESQIWTVGSHYNCSGTVSAWSTILSCEEYPPTGADSLGWVLEVYTTQPHTWLRRPFLGRFSHEKIIEDPVTGDFYLTDDSVAGVFFKFEPVYPGYLGRGNLFALNEPAGQWIQITNMLEAEQEALSLGATYHRRPEGLAYNPIDDAIYIMVTGMFTDPQSTYGYILRFDPRTNTMTRWLDGDGVQFANPDNVVVDACGNLIVQEDMYGGHIAQFGANRVVLIRPDRSITPVLRGLDASGEMSGLTLDAGDWRFWVNWMEGTSGSELIEVRLSPGWNCPALAAPVASPPARDGLWLSASPNPFATVTWLHGQVTPGQPVQLRIYDLRGMYCRTLVDGPLASGQFEIAWDGRDYRHRRSPSGYYFARLSAGARSTTARIVLTH